MTPPAPPPPINPPPGGRAAALRRLGPRVGRAVFVRMRFVAVLGLAFAVVAGWESLGNHWDRLTRGPSGRDAASQAVSADTEYFCPMDPGIVSDWPGKCPVCNMGLVRRTRGDATPLPDGVVARMQFSPYRLQLAGIQTTPAAYRPLAREVEGPGRAVSPTEAELDVFASEAAGLAAGQGAVLRADGPEPLRATVRAVTPRAGGREAAVRVELADGRGGLRPGEAVRGRVSVPADALEPFHSLPSDPPPLRKNEQRKPYACPDHPDVFGDRVGRCPKDGLPLEPWALSPHQRLRWWCPMHPGVTADAAGRKCEACGGMTLVPRVVSFRPRGEVLAVPEGAVIDTGKRTVVYVERMAGMFEGVEVVLGPRCGDDYPVARGLEPGQRVVTAGAFLVDAETRLNPGVAAAYFGASRQVEAAAALPPNDAPGDADRLAAGARTTCPVTGKPLGSMGPPWKITVEGRAVSLCCEACEPKLRKDPARYLAGPSAGPEAKRAP